MTVSTGDFIDVNAQRLTRLERQHPNVHKLRPGVVRRGHPGPDRSHVEGAALSVEPTAVEPPERKAEPVAAKRKKRARVDADTRAVAVARVSKLVAAGNPAGEAVASVAKELGVSESSVINWRTAANHAAKKTAKKEAKKAAKPAKKKRARRKTSEPPEARPGPSEGLLIEDHIMNALGSFVRAIVREEIRRMLS